MLLEQLDAANPLVELQKFRVVPSGLLPCRRQGTAALTAASADLTTRGEASRRRLTTPTTPGGSCRQSEEIHRPRYGAQQVRTAVHARSEDVAQVPAACQTRAP